MRLCFVLINIERNTERRKECVKRLEYIKRLYDIEYIIPDNSADGKEMSFDGNLLYVKDGGVYRYLPEKERDGVKGLVMNEVACAISHIRVYENLINNPDYDAYIVLEDDFEIVTENMGSLREVISTIGNNNLSLDFHSSVIPRTACLRKTPLEEDKNGIYLLHQPTYFTGNVIELENPFFYMSINYGFNIACSYVITKEAAREIIEKITVNNLITISLPADDLLERMDCPVLQSKIPFFSQRKGVISSIWNATETCNS